MVRKVFDELSERYADRTGGYTRIIKMGPRQGRRSANGPSGAYAVTSHSREMEEAAPGQLRRLALLVEYEGTRYHGFQSQRNASSVQDALEEALSRLTGERTRIRGAGRTDAGVHAQGQVVAFDTSAPYSPSVFLKALNRHLPDDVSVRNAGEVSPDFDPRRWAVRREYRYRISEQRDAVANSEQVHASGEEAAGTTRL